MWAGAFQLLEYQWSEGKFDIQTSSDPTRRFQQLRQPQWAGVPAEMGVFSLFSGLMRQEGLTRIDAAQQRQNLVPDLRIAIKSQAVADA